MPTILDKIVATKRREIAAARHDRPETSLRAALAAAPPPRDFATALAGPGPIRLIAEVKKASPSAGQIRADFDPSAIARIYQQHGAEGSAPSVRHINTPAFTYFASVRRHKKRKKISGLTP